MTDQNKNDEAKITELLNEISLLKVQADNKQWGLEKTNKAIKALYKDLEKKNQQLKKLDQLKTDFVSTVSHELRTPLAISIECTNLILDGIVGEVKPEQAQLLETSRNNLLRLNAIINDLLDISKIESGKLTLRKGLVDIKDLCSELAESYQKVLDTKKQTLTLNLPPESVELFVDGDKLIQVFTNLLNNAYKFTPQGGEITIGIALRNDQVLCTVSDTGMGISQEDVKNLFGKFQQFGRVDGPGIKGTGLGLAISKALVEMHGGMIWAQSEINQGTTFTFSLPSYESAKKTFDLKTQQLLKSSHENNNPVGFIHIYLDSYEKIIRNYGVSKAIEIINVFLSDIAAIVTRPDDQLFLYEKHSIQIILPHTNLEGTQQVLKRIRGVFRQRKFKVEDRADIKIKYGTACCPEDGVTKGELFNKAFEQMVKKRDILVIDDNQQTYEILKSRLKDYPVNILSVNDGKQAIEFLEKNSVDVIVLDIMMPKMNGYEFLRAFKEHPKFSFIDILIFSEKTKREIHNDCADLINISVIEKKQGFDQLISILIEYI